MAGMIGRRTRARKFGVDGMSKHLFAGPAAITIGPGMQCAARSSCATTTRERERKTGPPDGIAGVVFGLQKRGEKVTLRGLHERNRCPARFVGPLAVAGPP